MKQNNQNIVARNNWKKKKEKINPENHTITKFKLNEINWKGFLKFWKFCFFIFFYCCLYGEGFFVTICRSGVEVFCVQQKTNKWWAKNWKKLFIFYDGITTYWLASLPMLKSLYVSLLATNSPPAYSLGRLLGRMASYCVCSTYSFERWGIWPVSRNEHAAKQRFGYHSFLWAILSSLYYDRIADFFVSFETNKRKQEPKLRKSVVLNGNSVCLPQPANTTPPKAANKIGKRLDKSLDDSLRKSSTTINSLVMFAYEIVWSQSQNPFVSSFCSTCRFFYTRQQTLTKSVNFFFVFYIGTLAVDTADISAKAGRWAALMRFAHASTGVIQIVTTVGTFAILHQTHQKLPQTLAFYISKCPCTFSTGAGGAVKRLTSAFGVVRQIGTFRWTPLQKMLITGMKRMF